MEEGFLLPGLLRLMARLSVVEGVQSLLCPAQNVREYIDQVILADPTRFAASRLLTLRRKAFAMPGSTQDLDMTETLGGVPMARSSSAPASAATFWTSAVVPRLVKFVSGSTVRAA